MMVSHMCGGKNFTPGKRRKSLKRGDREGEAKKRESSGRGECFQVSRERQPINKITQEKTRERNNAIFLDFGSYNKKGEVCGRRDANGGGNWGTGPRWVKPCAGGSVSQSKIIGGKCVQL